MAKLRTERDTIFIPLSANGPDVHEIPETAYAVAPRHHPANFLGIPGRRLHPSRYDALKMFRGASRDDMFSWLSMYDYDRPCWKIDLRKLNPKQLRLYDPERGHIIYRGSIPSVGVISGVHLPRLTER